MTLGWREHIKSITNPLADVDWEVAAAGHKDKYIQYGLHLDGYSTSMTEHKVNSGTFYFNHTNSTWNKGLVAGSECKYDCSSKKFDTKLGLFMHLNDHSWKFRFHDTGLMRAGL